LLFDLTPRIPSAATADLCGSLHADATDRHIDTPRPRLTRIGSVAGPASFQIEAHVGNSVNGLQESTSIRRARGMEANNGSKEDLWQMYGRDGLCGIAVVANDLVGQQIVNWDMEIEYIKLLLASTTLTFSQHSHHRLHLTFHTVFEHASSHRHHHCLAGFFGRSSSYTYSRLLG